MSCETNKYALLLNGIGEIARVSKTLVSQTLLLRLCAGRLPPMRFIASPAIASSASPRSRCGVSAGRIPFSAPKVFKMTLCCFFCFCFLVIMFLLSNGFMLNCSPTVAKCMPLSRIITGICYNTARKAILYDTRTPK
jgi:hypothetical protein